MRIALTGATGYTGGHLLQALVQRGDEVAALVRDGSDSESVEKQASDLVSGDLSDVAAIEKLVDGADAVVHIAAVYRTAGHPDSYYRDINYGMGFEIQLMMYAVPVVYPVSLVPDQYRLLYSLNPMVGVIEGFRSALLGTNPMPWEMLGIGIVTALVIAVSGALYFRRMERIFADVV